MVCVCGGVNFRVLDWGVKLGRQRDSPLTTQMEYNGTSQVKFGVGTILKERCHRKQAEAMTVGELCLKDSFRAIPTPGGGPFTT